MLRAVRLFVNALETNDPWLAELVRRTDAGKDIIHEMQNLEINEDDTGEEKIAALAEMICRNGDEPVTNRPRCWS